MLIRDKDDKNILYSENKKFKYVMTGDFRDSDYIKVYDVLIKLGAVKDKDFIKFYKEVKEEILALTGAIPVNSKDTIEVKQLLKGIVRRWSKWKIHTVEKYYVTDTATQELD